MSRLLTINRRIKTAETIKKTTNALRLVAMSSHTGLRKARAALDRYVGEIDRLFAIQNKKNVSGLIDQSAQNEYSQKTSAKKEKQKIVYIVIGSQKGSCGSFNTGLAHYVKDHIESLGDLYDLIVIGKKMRDTLLYQKLEPITSYDDFNVRNVTSLANDLTRLILSATYQEARLFYTHPTSFFVHTHKNTVFLREQFYIEADLKSGSPDANILANASEPNPILYEQSYGETFNRLGFLALKANLENILANSLLAEASSRFLSMDSATHNAENLIETLQLEYNKLRQANITRELADLSAGFMQ